MFSAMATFIKQAFFAPVLGDEGDAVPDAARAAMRSPSRRSPTTMSPESMRIEAEENAGQLRAAGAHQPEHAEHFAAVEVESLMSLTTPAARERRGREQDASAAVRRARRDKAVRWRGRPSA